MRSQDTDSSQRVFIKHQLECSKGECPETVTEHEIITSGEYPHWPALLERDRSFREGGNPIHAIESFLLFQEAGLYPPVHILAWLANSLSEWHTRVQVDSNFTLERAMGLKTESGGRSANQMRNAVLEQFEEGLMIEMNRLIHTFSLSVTEAASMVSGRLEDTTWNSLDMPLPAYATPTLRDRFSKWKAVFDCHPGRDFAADLAHSSAEEKQQLLSHYPKHIWSHMEKLKDQA